MKCWNGLGKIYWSVQYTDVKSFAIETKDPVVANCGEFYSSLVAKDQ